MKLLTLFLLFSTSSHALEGLDNVKSETDKLVSEASSNIYFKCKCLVSFEVNWSSFPGPIPMKQVPYIVSNFNKAMPAFCADDGIQKACVIKKIKISYDTKTSSKLTDGVAELVTDGKSYEGFDRIVNVGKE